MRRSVVIAWVSCAVGVAVGAGIALAIYDVVAVASRAGLGGLALAHVALSSAGLGTLVVLVPALVLALLVAAAFQLAPGDALRGLWAARSARGVVGGTVGVAVYAVALGAFAVVAADRIRTDSLRQTAVSLAGIAALPVAWLVAAAAGRAVERRSFRLSLAVPAAVLVGVAVVLARSAGTIALLGPDPVVAPLAALAGAVAGGLLAARARGRARFAAPGLVVVLALVLALPRGDTVRAALAFDAPSHAALSGLLPVAGGVHAVAGRPPSPFSLTARTHLRRRWPVVFVTVDSLRPDHVGAYGYRRPTTPHIDAFARTALRFDRAYATGSSTRFSLPSLMTGRFMSQLAMQGRAILPENTTFAELLAAAGWHTVGIMGPTERGTGPGVGQGFRTFRHSRDLHGEHIDRGITDEALSLLAEAPKGKPLLLWVHYYDPYTPFAPQEDAPDWGRGDADRYDSEVWSTDREVGRLLAAVDARFGADGAVVIVSADHGEAFGEHGKVGHSAQLYEELVRVPLLIRVPGGRRGHSAQLASLLDVMPTLLDLTGIVHHAVLEGRSLLPQIEGAAPDPERIVFEELRFGRPEDHGQTAAHLGHHQLILDAATGVAVLYDVSRDAREAHPLPLSGKNAAIAARMRAAVLGLRARIEADNAHREAGTPSAGDDE